MNALTKTEKEPAVANGSKGVNYVTPFANIVETKDGYVLEAEMPGVTKEGLEITVENGQLLIIGRRAPVERKGRELFRESRGLDYRRAFELDSSIDAPRIGAKLDQGVVRLTLPKADAVKPRKITVG